jgi:hypothetical protein
VEAKAVRNTSWKLSDWATNFLRLVGKLEQTSFRESNVAQFRVALGVHAMMNAWKPAE